MPLERRVGFVGVSKQTVKGTPVTPPLFGFGSRGGQLFNAEIDQADEELTSLTRVAPGAFRNSVLEVVTFTTRLYPRVLGLLYYGLMGSIADSGTNPNFTHTITVANTLPYLTGYARLDTEYAQVRDMRVAELNVSWDGAEMPELEGRMVGTVLTYGTTWTATNDEAATSPLPTAGGTFKVDTGSATAVVADIAGGEIRMSNNIQPVQLSKALEADDTMPGLFTLECELKLLPANLNEWRKIVTGTAGGTAVASAVTYGSFDMLFTLDANTSLQITANKVAFTADYPEVDPAGGPAELTVVGSAFLPTGSTIQAIVKNSTASY